MSGLRCYTGSSHSITGDLVKDCAYALVVVNMRALDSYCERLRMSTRLRTQREEGIGEMAGRGRTVTSWLWQASKG